MRQEITESDRCTLTHCLRVSADQFDADANLAAETVKDGGRLQRTFIEQAEKARHWADRIDNADELTIVVGSIDSCDGADSTVS